MLIREDTDQGTRRHKTAIHNSLFMVVVVVVIIVVCFLSGKFDFFQNQAVELLVGASGVLARRLGELRQVGGFLLLGQPFLLFQKRKQG